MSKLTGSILVVDDNRMNRLMLARAWNSKGTRSRLRSMAVKLWK